MKLPVIKHISQFIEENDEDYIIETIEVLEKKEALNLFMKRVLGSIDK